MNIKVDANNIDFSLYFQRFSFPAFLKNRHPYNYVETYEAMKHVYGYRLNYVNLGYWPQGKDTQEPGRQLALHLGEALDLKPGDKLIDAGSGLGQGAVDLLQEYHLDRVIGINPNRQQLAFANQLAKNHQLDDKVQHHCGDAGTYIEQLKGQRFNKLMAMECISYFSDSEHFLHKVHSLLPPGGKVAFCLNVANNRISLFQRYWIRMTWGFFPSTVDMWKKRLADAGFQYEYHDITEKVLEPMTRICLNKINENKNLKDQFNPLIFMSIKSGLQSARKRVLSGELSYGLFVGVKP